MLFSHYRELAMRTAKLYPQRDDNLNHSLLGLCTEIGEFASELKRHVIYGKPLYEVVSHRSTGEPVTRREHMLEELGDACWYIPLGLYAISAGPVLPPCNEPTEDDMLALTFVVWGIAGGMALDALTPINNRRNLQAHFLVVRETIAKLARMLGSSIEELYVANIAKLQLRFPNAYSDEAAEARADKGGLSALES